MLNENMFGQDCCIKHDFFLFGWPLRVRTRGAKAEEADSLLRGGRTRAKVSALSGRISSEANGRGIPRHAFPEQNRKSAGRKKKGNGVQGTWRFAVSGTAPSLDNNVTGT